MTKCERITAEVPIESVLQKYGITVQPNRNIKCFVHKDNSPSMAVRNGRVKCFACQWSGNVIDVVQHFANCDTKEAISIINEWFRLFDSSSSTLTQKMKWKKRAAQLQKEREEKERLKAEKQAYSLWIIDAIRECEKEIAICAEWFETLRDLGGEECRRIGITYIPHPICVLELANLEHCLRIIDSKPESIIDESEQMYAIGMTWEEVKEWLDKHYWQGGIRKTVISEQGRKRNAYTT